MGDAQKAAIIAELTEIEYRIPGAITRIKSAALTGKMHGVDYERCALGYAVKGTTVSAIGLSVEITEKFYGEDRNGLFLEYLIHMVYPGVRPTGDSIGSQQLKELLMIIEEIEEKETCN